MLLHIASHDDWVSAQANGAYRADSLATEGFVHCSTPEQVLIPANERYSGVDGLVLLVIDANELTAPLVWEDCYETGMEFPHVYGPIPVNAVTRVVDFPCGSDGIFSLPDDLVNAS